MQAAYRVGITRDFLNAEGKLALGDIGLSLLDEVGIKVHRTDFGPYLTCQEMAGFSVTFCRLDKDLKRWIDSPCWSLGYWQN